MTFKEELERQKKFPLNMLMREFKSIAPNHQIERFDSDKYHILFNKIHPKFYGVEITYNCGCFTIKYISLPETDLSDNTHFICKDVSENRFKHRLVEIFFEEL